MRRIISTIRGRRVEWLLWRSLYHGLLLRSLVYNKDRDVDEAWVKGGERVCGGKGGEGDKSEGIEAITLVPPMQHLSAPARAQQAATPSQILSSPMPAKLPAPPRARVLYP